MFTKHRWNVLNMQRHPVDDHPGNVVFPMLMHYLCFTNTTTPGIQAAATVQLLQN